MSDIFVEAFRSVDGQTEIYHRDGIPWHKAPIPRRWHRCWAQSKAWFRFFEYVERCACGGIRDRHNRWRRWDERNSRRRDR